MTHPTQRELSEKALELHQQRVNPQLKPPQEVESDDPLLNEDQAAAYYGIGVRSLQRWRMTGEGPKFTRLGRHVRYRRSWLDAHADSGARTSTSAA